MKKPFLISLISLSSILTMNAQWNGTGTSPLWTNNNVGIGVSNPSTKLQIQGGEIWNFYNGGSPRFVIGDGAGTGEYGFLRWNSTAKDLRLGFNAENDMLIVKQNGNVGIGTSAPEEILTLKKMGGDATLAFNSNDVVGAHVGIDFSDNYRFKIGGGQNVGFADYLTINLTGNNQGYIGIGTAAPAYKLDVCGTIRAQEVKVDLLGGCDFVFKNDYKLMDLKTLDNFVKTNQHLPDIASEKEMVENGVNMKELQMKLLQKIEELTLYTIEQNKELQMLKEKIAKLEAASK